MVDDVTATSTYIEVVPRLGDQGLYFVSLSITRVKTSTGTGISAGTVPVIPRFYVPLYLPPTYRDMWIGRREKLDVFRGDDVLLSLAIYDFNLVFG